MHIEFNFRLLLILTFNYEESEKEDSKPDQSTTLDSSGLVESAEATTTTTEPSDDKSTDEVHEENSSAEAPTKHTEGEVNSSKADDSSNMEALQLTEPDDLYDEYREVRFFAKELPFTLKIFCRWQETVLCSITSLAWRVLSKNTLLYQACQSHAKSLKSIVFSSPFFIPLWFNRLLFNQLDRNVR